MSTEQPTLGEAIERGVQRWRDERTGGIEGARYVGGTPADQRDGEPADAGCCQACGEPLEAATQRVVGDNHGRVPACKHCADDHETTATAALDARMEGRLL